MKTLALAIAVIISASAVAQVPGQFKASFTWDQKSGWEEKLFFEPMGWDVKDFLGLKGFDLTPFTWGDPIYARSGGFGVYHQRAIARNVWVQIGPTVVFESHERPRVGLFVGASVDVFKGR